MKCINCQVELIGKQKKYCSRKCHNKSGNTKHQNYECQQKRGLERKIMFVKKLGGKCDICGYAKNYASLSFHHLDPNKKETALDIRHMSNNNMTRLTIEIAKCQLLCLNCHMEIEHPTLKIG